MGDHHARLFVGCSGALRDIDVGPYPACGDVELIAGSGSVRGDLAEKQIALHFCKHHVLAAGWRQRHGRRRTRQMDTVHDHTSPEAEGVYITHTG